MQRVCLRAALQPFAVAPRVVHVPNDGGGARRQFAAKRERIALVYAVAALLRDDLIFIDRTRANAFDES